MADQLSINITTPGADAAVAALRNVQTAMQQVTSATSGIASGAAQAGSATTQLTSQMAAATTAAQGTHGAFLSLGSSLGALPGPLGQVGRGFGALSVSLNQAQVGLVAVGGAMMAAGAGIAAGLGEAIKEATQYQRTFAEVQVVSQATATEMTALQNKAIELGASTQFNSQKIAKAFYELSSAGLTVTESLQAIEPITRMATLGNLDLGKSAEDVVKILRQYSLDAGQTSHVVDVLTVAVQGSILHWNEIGEAYRNIAGRAHGMNVSLEETTGALMVASNAGLTAAMAGTAVGTFLDRLAKGSGEAGAAISQLKLRLYDEQGAFVGLNQVVRQVAEATSGMTEAESNSVLSKLAGARASGFLRNALAQELPVMIDGNQVVLKGADLLDYYTQQAKNADGASRKAAETIQQTLDAQLKILSGTVQEVGIRLGTEFIPALSAIVPQVTSMINQFVQAPPNIHATAAALLAVASATTIAAGGFLTATAVAAAFGTTLAAAAAAAIAAAAPILAIGAAVALLSVAWINDWGNIRETTTATATVITAASTQTVADLTTIADYLTTILIPRWQQWVDLQTTPTTPASGAPTPIAGLTPGINPALSGASAESEVALATAQGANTGEAWSKGYVASITEDASGEKITGILLLDPSAMNAQGGIAGGAMGTAFSDEFTNTVTNGSVTAFSTMDSAWGQTLDNMKKEMEAQQLTIHIFDAEAHRAELYDQGALSGTIVAKAMGESLAAKFDPALALQMAMDRIRTLVKDNLSKAVQEAAAEGNQAAADAFLKEETMRAAITAAIKDSDAARKAEILTMQAQQGVEDTLLHLFESGSISAEAYANAINGVAASHTKAKTASEEHKAALAAMVQSTDAAAVSQGLYEQHLDEFIEKTARSLPAIEGQARALINAGDSMGALKVEAQALGLSEETLVQASQGVVSAQNAVKAALEGVTGSHEKAKTAAKTHAEALKELVGSSDASLVAIGLADQAYDKFATATLPKLSAAVQAQVTALRNAGESQQAAAVAANAYGFSLDDVNKILDGNVATLTKWNAALKGEAVPLMNSYSTAMLAAADNFLKAQNAQQTLGLGVDQISAITTRAIAIQKEWQAALKEDEAAGRATGGSFTVLRDSFQQAADEIAKAAAKAQTAAGGFRQVGGYITDGIRTGMGDFSAKELFDRLNGTMRQGVNDMKSQWGIQSPSSVMAAEVGLPLAQGIGTGFEQGMPALLSTIQSGINQVTESASAWSTDAMARFNRNQQQNGYPGPFNAYQLGDPGGMAALSSKQAAAFMDAQKQYWENTYGTSDPTKAQAAYTASLPAGAQAGFIYQNLLNSAASSQLNSLLGKLPLAQQASYQQMAQGGPENAMAALQTLWAQGGGSAQTLSNLLNNIQQPAGLPGVTYAPPLGATSTGSGGGGEGGGASSQSTTIGSGLATAPGFIAVNKGGVAGDVGQDTPTLTDTIARYAADVARTWSVAKDNAKRLSDSSGLVSQAWSSIADLSKSVESSISKIPGAFSAFAIDLNSKMASSISGSWTLPTIGGPSGPMAGPGGNPSGIPSGSTYGGQSFSALQALAAQVTAEHPDLSADSQARLIQQAMRTNQDYIKAVGPLTDTTDDLRRQQADAANQVQNLTNVVNLQGAAYAAGSGALAALQDAQANLTNVTNALAANVSATTISAPTPTPQAPTTPVPTTSQIANLTTGQFYVLNSAGELVVSTAQNLSGAPTSPTTAPRPATPTSTSTPTPVTTTPSTTTTTTTTATKPTGPVKIGTTATGLDVYQMPDGSIARVPKGSPPPGTVPVPVPTTPLPSAPSPRPLTPLEVLNQINTGLGLPPLASAPSTTRPTDATQTTPYRASSPAVSLTANITLNNAASTPQLAAVLVRQIREEFRRQGTDVMRIGGI